LEQFFSLIGKIETYEAIGFRRHSIRRGTFLKEGNRFVREFHYDWMRDHLSVEELAEFLGQYVRMLKKGMDIYFSLVGEDEPLVLSQLYDNYKEHF
jgi:hypothetical protein